MTCLQRRILCQDAEWLGHYSISPVVEAAHTYPQKFDKLKYV